MIFYIFSYFILFLPLMLAVDTSNMTVTSNVTSNNSSTVEVSNNITQSIKKSDFIKTKVIEGSRTLVTETVPSTLPKENHNTLLDLDPEFNITKKTGVKARKGALLPQEDFLKLKKTNVEESKVTITTDKVDSKPNNTLVEITTIPTVPKKPTILHGDDLNKLEVKNYAEKLAPVGGKSKVVTPNKQPGIVIPIVITILVVPAFAALSYMALKRGKEAWKNRHYKRMDFLLEGMYND